MTIVNTEPGELVDVMSEADARAITARIRSLAESIADRIDLLVVKVREAQQGHAHVALGYRSWTAYVEAEFAGMLPRLDREPRRELVTVLAETGMSTRAIAPVVGVSHETVAQDLSSPVRNLTPETPEGERDEPTAGSPTPTPSGGQSAPSRPPVTGRDGKTYPAPEPNSTGSTNTKTRPRRALADQFFDAVFDLGKAVDRVQRLTDDNRFPQNAQKVAAKNRDDLQRARDVLADVLARMP